MFKMNWCGPSTSMKQKYRTINEKRQERKAWLVIVRPQFLTRRDTKGVGLGSLS